MIKSEGPILIMVFSSGTSQGQGFKGVYFFETFYKIPGTPDPPGCRFKYLSESGKTGDFNSPRHPANYPALTDCTYEFYGSTGEQVHIVFNYFRMKADSATIGYNEFCTEDWVEIYEMHPSGREFMYGRFCANTAPGPILSDVGVNSMKVILRTDETAVASGFSATYQFLPTMTSLGGTCAPIHSLINHSPCSCTQSDSRPNNLFITSSHTRVPPFCCCHDFGSKAPAEQLRQREAALSQKMLMLITACLTGDSASARVLIVSASRHSCLSSSHSFPQSIES